MADDNTKQVATTCFAQLSRRTSQRPEILRQFALISPCNHYDFSLSVCIFSHGKRKKKSNIRVTPEIRHDLGQMKPTYAPNLPTISSRIRFMSPQSVDKFTTLWSGPTTSLSKVVTQTGAQTFVDRWPGTLKMAWILFSCELCHIK